MNATISGEMMDQVEALSRSRVYRDYQQALTGVIDLPLCLQNPALAQIVEFPTDQQSPFCALVARTTRACAACNELQQQLAKDALSGPTTLKCFAGLCESAVPVRVGENVLAFLRTGQIFLHRPNGRLFNRAATTLLKWGAQIDLKQLEAAYYQTRVISPKKYESFIRLLAIFAEHLAASSAALLAAPHETEPDAVAVARAYVTSHHLENLSLARVAQAVNLSASYFSDLFKRTTGMRFLEYIAKVRLERARKLLQNRHQTITKIAMDAGFRSLSQFNRLFKKSTGCSPRDYRRQLLTQSGLPRGMTERQTCSNRATSKSSRHVSP